MEKEESLKYGKILLRIIANYFSNEKEDIELSNEDLSKLLQIAESNSVLLLFYRALVSNGISLPSKIDIELNKRFSMNLRKTILFEEERKALYSYMDERKISYLPLKGILINELYPEYGSREFADNDILFDAKHKKDIKEFFVKRGYKVEEYSKGVHDTYLKEPFYNFEMHRSLFLDYNRSDIIKGFEKYFDNYLYKGERKGNSYMYLLSKEDFLIYFFAHLYKHYSLSGCGIRTFIDIETYLRKYPSFDWEYFYNELNKIKIDSFVKEMIELTNHLFSKSELTKREGDLLLYMLGNGTYGNLESAVKNSLKKESKGKYIFHRLFPPMSFYKVNYPKMYKSKVLIPLAWFIRLFKGIFFNHKKVKKELEYVNEKKD